MTTLKSIARKMFELAPHAIGRAEALTGLTTTTAACASLAQGGVTGQRYVDRYMLRRDTTSAADRVRRCVTFDATSGTFTHAGTNYADTTATGELLEILDHEPYAIDLAIQRALARTTQQDAYVLPTRQGMERYSLSDLTWLEDPGDILGIMYAGSPVITNNRSFEEWNGVTSAGLLTPDNWTLSGTSATIVRSTTHQRFGYNVAITRAGTTCTLAQSPGLLDTGVAGESLIGETVTAVAWVWASTASQARVQMTDGITTVNNSYHTGGSGWEELSISMTPAVTATGLTGQVSVEVDGTIQVDEAYMCCGELTDAIRRNSYQRQALARNQWDFAQDEGVIYLPTRGRGGQYIISTKRSYPQFDATRVAAGTADADVTDAPELTVATGAIGRLFESLYSDVTDESAKQRYLVLANTWNRRFEGLALKHLVERSERGFGVDLPVISAGRMTRRI